MKIRYTMELELPEVPPEDNDQEEFIPGMTYEMAWIGQLIADQFTHYAVIKHSEDALNWYIKSETQEPVTNLYKSNAKKIHELHTRWREILTAAEQTVQIEKI